jgi:hypothetical protein
MFTRLLLNQRRPSPFYRKRMPGRNAMSPEYQAGAMTVSCSGWQIFRYRMMPTEPRWGVGRHPAQQHDFGQRKLPAPRAGTIEGRGETNSALP